MQHRFHLLVACLSASACSVSPDSRESAEPVKKWESDFIKIALVPRSRAGSGRSLNYSVKFSDREKMIHVPSQIEQTEVDEAFAKSASSSFSSAVIFSTDGKQAVIQDISPGSASGETSYFLIDLNLPNSGVRFLPPTRPGPLIPITPTIASISSKEAVFRFDEDPRFITVELPKLMETATPVEPSAP
jgi:hypothetical protein